MGKFRPGYKFRGSPRFNLILQGSLEHKLHLRVVSSAWNASDCVFVLLQPPVMSVELQDTGEAAPVPKHHPLSVPCHQRAQIGWAHRVDEKDPWIAGQAPTVSTTVRVIFFFSFKSLFFK